MLLKEINRQLEEKNIIITQGRINIIDATPIEAAQSGPGKAKSVITYYLEMKQRSMRIQPIVLKTQGIR
jgi:hypothetical protein